MPTTNGELAVTVTVSGLADPGQAEVAIVAQLKRALYLVNGTGDFTARIDGPSGSIGLDERREWQRVRDSNPRGTMPYLLSGQAP